MIFGNKVLAFLAALAMTGSFLASTADAHGYVTISRSKKCADGVNTNCGSIVFEPQSLEGPKGYPGAGPPDGQLASAGLASFANLNEQSTSRWHKTSTATGSYDFVWQFTANHVTSDWQYFITRPGWNQNAPLTRSSFDSTSFCSVGGNDSQPPTQVTHTCTIPSDRSGYHVVLAVWNIGDTPNAFYSMIDFELGTGGVSPTPPVSAPAPTTPVGTSPSTGGYCSWTGTCGGADPSATWCNESQERCMECGGSLYCSGNGGSPPAPVAAPVAPPAPTSPSTGGYCSWTGTCGGADPSATWCNDSQERCMECGGSLYCSGNGGSPPAPVAAPVAPPAPTSPSTGGYCSWTGTCGGADPSATWCNDSQERCMECGGSLYCSGSGGSNNGGGEAPTCGGGNVGNGRCGGGMCCSEWGWCGCTPDHCINGQFCSRRLRGRGVNEEPAAGPDGGEANVVA